MTGAKNHLAPSASEPTISDLQREYRLDYSHAAKLQEALAAALRRGREEREPEIELLTQQARKWNAEADRYLAQRDELTVRAEAAEAEVTRLNSELDAIGVSHQALATDYNRLQGEVTRLRQSDIPINVIATCEHCDLPLVCPSAQAEQQEIERLHHLINQELDAKIEAQQHLVEAEAEVIRLSSSVVKITPQ